MKHKHADAIKAWADGAQIEHLSLDGTWVLCNGPLWNEFTEYRIYDPYAELKAAAQDQTKQIRLIGGEWYDAGERVWLWVHTPDSYKIRNKPAARKVKLLAWLVAGELRWFTEDTCVSLQVWKRVPSEDKEIVL
jgi:hypothetical protein